MEPKRYYKKKKDSTARVEKVKNSRMKNELKFKPGGKASKTRLA